MKKLFAALFCCVLCVAGVSAQNVQSVIEAPDSGVVLASAQDETTPTVPSPDDGIHVEGQASATDVPSDAMILEGHGTVVEGQMVGQGGGCGCGSSVVGYAAPNATYTSSACGCGNYAPANDCCNYTRGARRAARTQVVRGFRGRWASSNRGNNCCCY